MELLTQTNNLPFMLRHRTEMVLFEKLPWWFSTNEHFFKQWSDQQTRFEFTANTSCNQEQSNSNGYKLTVAVHALLNTSHQGKYCVVFVDKTSDSTSAYFKCQNIRCRLFGTLSETQSHKTNLNHTQFIQFGFSSFLISFFFFCSAINWWVFWPFLWNISLFSPRQFLRMH